MICFPWHDGLIYNMYWGQKHRPFPFLGSSGKWCRSIFASLMCNDLKKKKNTYLPHRWASCCWNWACARALLAIAVSLCKSVIAPSKGRRWLNGQGLWASSLREFHTEDMSGGVEGWANGYEVGHLIIIHVQLPVWQKRYVGKAVIISESSLLWCS